MARLLFCLFFSVLVLCLFEGYEGPLSVTVEDIRIQKKSDSVMLCTGMEASNILNQWTVFFPWYLR